MQLDVLVAAPAGTPTPKLALAAGRAGAIGVVDLRRGFDDQGALTDDAVDALQVLNRHGRGRHGVHLEVSQVNSGRLEAIVACLADMSQEADSELRKIVLEGWSAGDGPGAVSAAHNAHFDVFAVVTNADDAIAAADAGVAAVVAKGNEAGGWVGEESAFILAQRVIDAVDAPVWVQGGIGEHTAAAVLAAGGAGVVLDSQVLLTKETPLPLAAQERLRTTDGTHTALVGAQFNSSFRCFAGPAMMAPEVLVNFEVELVDAWNNETLSVQDRQQLRGRWIAEVNNRCDWTNIEESLLAVGQDATLASYLGERYVTVAGVVDAIRDCSSQALQLAAGTDPFGPDSAMARSHGTEYAIAQGPMTRVSDRAEFAASVAEAGGLPFVALSLMRGPDVAELIKETTEKAGVRPWGIGLLGFLPPELLHEQLEAVRSVGLPPLALIAGGRPAQAADMEAEGTEAYLHVPSPALLKIFLREGARKFVFEGRECGGHVGPRSSFVLWDQVIDILTNDLPRGVKAQDVHVLFAGGVHDGRSAGMVGAAAARLSHAGMKVGTLMGTAYLFTEEAVTGGAITKHFQDAAIAGETTVLLESGPGHATRCLQSPFVDEFLDKRQDLRRDGVPSEETKMVLEELNVGRLRIASKALDRNPDPEAPADQRLVSVTEDDQWQKGLYMIGQVAALRDRVVPMSELHAEVVNGAKTLLADTPTVVVKEEPSVPPADVAIVGMSSIMPGSDDFTKLFDNLVHEVDSISAVPEKRWSTDLYYDEDIFAKDKTYGFAGGFIDDVDFDPVEFLMPPTQVAFTEVFQLLALLTAKRALQHAGYDTRPFNRERASVILGAGGGGGDMANDLVARAAMPGLFGEVGFEMAKKMGNRLPEWSPDTFPGLLMNVAAGRIANRLDFGGANYTTDAACASSISALSNGVRDLQTGTSDLVLSGGVDFMMNVFSFLCFSKTPAMSPRGRSRPFDADADGIAIGEGVGIVVLKRLEDAERDGDTIYAVIKGVGASSDGKGKGLTAPRPGGQMRALRRAYSQAGFSPTSVGLFEAHGTGTVAGDKAELESLSTVLTLDGAEPRSAAVGSIKSNIGHAKIAAGVAGLIKTVLALHHKVLPPTIGVESHNETLVNPEFPLYANTHARPWVHTEDHPRRAGVSAFGFGGTNFHVALEEYVPPIPTDQAAPVREWRSELLIWRAESLADLRAAVLRSANKASKPKANLLALAKDLAHSNATSKKASGRHSVAVVTKSLEQLSTQLEFVVQLLDGNGPGGRYTRDGIFYSPNPVAFSGSETDQAGANRVAFLFSGQGSQQVDMGCDLAVRFPSVREHFELADRLFEKSPVESLSSFIFPPPAASPEEAKAQRLKLTRTDIAQPALGVLEASYLDLLASMDVAPDVVAGHSYGEIVALMAAGAIDEVAMLKLSEARGRVVAEETQGNAGTMAAVSGTREQLRELLEKGDVIVANSNAPDQIVLAGGEDEIRSAVKWCQERKITATKLPVSCAFHSSFLDSASVRLAEEAAGIDFAPTKLPVYSNTTGDVLDVEPAALAGHLAKHLVSPVEFDRQITKMRADGVRLFVEIGPRSVLTNLVGKILADEDHVAVSIDRPGTAGVEQLQNCLATMAAEGVTIDLRPLFVNRTPVAPRPERTSTTFVIDGGRARPHTEPPFIPKPFSLGALMNETPTSNGSTNGSAAEAPVANGHAPKAAQAQAPAATPVAHVAAAPAPAPVAQGAPGPVEYVTGTGSVMDQYHQVMARFLDTERSVMMSFLGQPQAATEVVPYQPVVQTAQIVAPAPMPQIAAPAPAPAPAPESAPAPAPAPTAVAPVTPEPAPVAAQAPPSLEVAPVAGSASDGPVMRDIDDIEVLMLDVVADRTGYPKEMLDLDADMEADLGIDSIKKVEIAGTMLDELQLSPDDIDQEGMIAASTLREAMDVLERSLNNVVAGGTDQDVPLAQAPATDQVAEPLLDLTQSPTEQPTV